MASFIIKKFTALFGRGHERTIKIKKNIVISVLLRGGSTVIGFLLLPVTIHYISPLQFGIWLTVSSIVSWMNNFDIGLSSGLRNKLANALALGEHESALKYVSTTYAALIVISLITFLLFFIVGSYFDWNSILNVPANVLTDTWTILVIVLSCFCVQFVLQTVNTILTASHQVYKVWGISLLGQFLSLAVIYVLSKYTVGNLQTLVGVLAGMPVLVLLMASLILFRTDLKTLVPKLKYVDVKSARSLLGVGGMFFFLQMGSIIVYQTDNIIISGIKDLGPLAVTKFNVAYKLFTSLSILAAIIMMPYWSAFTDAYAKNDFDWIKNGLRRMRQIWLLLSGVSVAFFVFSPFIYKYWLGPGSIDINPSVSLSMAIYVIVYIFQLMYTFLQNGLGKIRLQLVSLIVCACINVPLSLYWGRRYGLAGIVNANTAVTIIMNVLLYIQSVKILNRTAKGIWGK